MQVSVFEDSVAELIYIVVFLSGKSKNKNFNDSCFYYKSLVVLQQIKSRWLGYT